MSGTLRAGIAGYGYMGEIRKRNVENHDALDLVGIADPKLVDDDRDATSELGVPVLEGYEDLVDGGLDVLFVCTPNVVTPEAIIYGLENGCHVFSEKPPGRDLKDVERIRSVEQRHPDLRLIFGFNHRHHPAIQDAKALVEDGSMGELLWIRGVYGKSGGPDFEASWRNDPEVGGGGILLDQGIHMLDLFTFFAGDFPDVKSLTTTAHWDVPMEDNAMVVLRSEDDVLAQIHSSATLWNHTFRLQLGLEQGYLIAEGLLSKSGSYGRETLTVARRPPPGQETFKGNPREEVTYYDHDPSWQVQVDHLVECILEDEPIQDSTSEEAYRVMEIIDRVYRENDADYVTFEKDAEPPEVPR